ncbi:MAG: hypothetical protein JXR76_25760 [Deltaproteobacteria bacterium]|nr:hypothetical protein [Deltaproteobacteria bacterium]
MKNILILTVLCGVLLAGHGLAASMSKELTYSETVVWRCAVRFIRVDNGFQILEKDKETGYLLFEYRDAGISANGSLEVLKVVKNNREYVRVQMNIHGQPKYIESLLFKKLERKLKSEYGMAPDAKFVGPDKTAAAENATQAETKGKAVDEEATEEELQLTEDDLNQNHDE